MAVKPPLPPIVHWHAPHFLGIAILIAFGASLVLQPWVPPRLLMLASWNIERYVKGYCILFLFLETGMLGTFLALDFFLFYIFWEIMLLPMYFLIGNTIHSVGAALRGVQTGYLRSYVLFLVLAAVCIYVALSYFVALAAG